MARLVHQAGNFPRTGPTSDSGLYPNQVLGTLKRLLMVNVWKVGL